MSRWRTQLDDLVAQRGRALVAYAYIVCGDRHKAEDLVQEALVRVFSRLRSPTTSSTVYALQPDAGPAHPEAYVRQAILAIHIDDHRRRRRWNARQHLLVDEGLAPSPASGATVRADVATALTTLTPKQRACVVLRFYDDLTVPQIARMLNVAEGTVKRHLSDATGKLRVLLANEGSATHGSRYPWPTTDGGSR